MAETSADVPGQILAAPVLGAVPFRVNQDRDDDALVAATLDDPEVFRALYERYMPRVYRFCRTRAATAEDAADLTQQTFSRAFLAIRRYRLGSNGFAPWLFRIARNAAIDARRRQRPTVALDDAERLPSGEASDPAARVVVADDLERLRQALAALRPEHRDLITLHFTAGLTVREVALVVGKSESATRMQIWRTLRALRKETEA